MKKLFLIIISLFFSVLYSKGQNPDWIVYHTGNSGLPDYYIVSIAIDLNGNKWIGTLNGGLAIFDDSNWTVYNTTNSNLPNNYIRSITIDSNGIKWIGTAGGLAKFDDSNWTIYKTSNSGLPNNDVWSIVIDENGHKWVGTYSGGIVKFDDTNWTVYNTLNSNLPNNWCRSIIIDANGDKLIGTWNGFAKFNNNNWTIYNTSNSGLSGNNVTSLTIDINGDIWIGTLDGGLSKFDGTNWTIYNTSNSDLPDIRVRSIAVDDYGDKWIGSFGGLSNLEGSTWTNYNTSNSNLPHNNVWPIFLDTNSDKWIGTAGGLAVFKANRNIGIDSLIAITDSVCGTADHEIKIKLKNYGNMRLSDIEVTALISGDITDTLTAIYSNIIYPDESKNFTVGTFNPDQGGNIEILVYSSMPNDIDRSNDTLHFQSHFFPYPATPDVKDDSLCRGDVVTLTGTNTNNLTKWYLFTNSTFVLYTGSSYTTPKINNTMWYNVINYTENNCPSEIREVKVTVNSLPNVPDIVQGVIFEGDLNSGTIQEPDEFCVGNKISYEFPPPTGYNNSEFGDKWGVSVDLKTPDSHLASSFIFNDPVANNNASLTFTASTAEADSIFKLTAEYILYPSLCTETVSRYVKVNPLPEVDFTVDVPCENSTTSFTSTSAIASGNLIGYEWDFGDGNTSTFLGPVNTYFASGTYSVRLKVTSDALCVNETTKEIDIYEMPQADFEASIACAMNSFSFINLSSYSEGSEVLNYEWDFGINNETSTDFEPLYKYENTGSYLVSLKATSPDGCVNTISKNIQVLDKPFAEFEVEDACAGSILKINNLSDGNQLTSHWSFGDGKESTDYEPEHAYEISGVYEIILTVTDANGCSDQFTSQINIFELPDAVFTYEEFMGKAKFTPNNETYSSYTWDFGDGNGSTDRTSEHEYSENGNYEVRLKVEGENGCINEEVMSITLSTVSTETIADKRSLNFKVYPNPFHNEAILSYELNKSTEVSIVLYDINGKEPAIIERGYKQPGTHTTILNTIDTGLAAGVYIIQLQVGKEVVVEKVVVLE